MEFGIAVVAECDGIPYYFPDYLHARDPERIHSGGFDIWTNVSLKELSC
jgi:hypothetical protein